MKFTENEKNIIRKLVHYDNFHQSTIGKFLTDEVFNDGHNILISIKPKSENPRTAFYYNKQCNNPSQLLYNTIEALSVFNKLEKCGLVVIAAFPNPPAVELVGKNINMHNSTRSHVLIDFPSAGQYISKDDLSWKDSKGNKIYDHIIIENNILQLTGLLSSILWVSEDLRILVQNNFLTTEEKHNRTQKRMTWIAIAVAVIVPFLAAWFIPTKMVESQFQKVDSCGSILIECQKQTEKLTIIVDSLTSNNP